MKHELSVDLTGGKRISFETGNLAKQAHGSVVVRIGDNVVLAVVNVDPHNPQSGWIELDLDVLNLDANRPFQVHELLSGARYTWHGPRNYVQLNPAVVPAHIFRIRRKVRTERDFEYFL